MKKITDDDGTNYVEGGIEQNAFFFGLIVAAPFLSLLLAYLTSEEMALGDVAWMLKQPCGMCYGRRNEGIIGRPFSTSDSIFIIVYGSRSHFGTFFTRKH